MSAMEESDLNSLLINAEQLALNPEENVGELPKIDRTLKQVSEATDELWSRLASETSKDEQANLLLSMRGIDLPHLSSKLERITARRSLQPLDPTPVTNISSFLRNELENSILGIVENTGESFEKEYRNRSNMEMKKISQMRTAEFLNSLYGLAELDPEVALSRKIYPLKELYLNSTGNLDQYQLAYAEALIEYNQDVLNGRCRFDLLKRFESVISPHDQRVAELWKISAVVNDVPHSSFSQETVQRSRPAVQEALVNSARSYLEKRYKGFMETIVSNQMLKACRGGEPGTYSLVRSFIKVSNLSEYLGMEQVFVDGLPLWPLIYYCLRCGDLNAAAHCIDQIGQDFKGVLNIIRELQSNPSRFLALDMEKEFLLDYKRLVRNTPDPFKRIVYCSLGGCDPNEKHPEVVKTADDYLWLKLCQVRKPTSGHSYRLSYEQLQLQIRDEYGSSRFNQVEDPHIYFQMMFLTGQFEAAIDALYTSSKYAFHAVHIAIALNQLKLLVLPDNLHRPILSQDNSMEYALNFGSILKTYVSTLPEADANLAINYLFCARDIHYSVSPGKTRSMFTQLMYEFLIKSDNYDKVLGYFEANGSRVAGLYDQFASVKDENMIHLVAQYKESTGDYFNAIQLYELGGFYEKVMLEWSTQMSRHLTKYTPESEEIRTQLYEYAERFLSRTDESKLSTHADTKFLFDSLLTLYTFLSRVKAKDGQTALEIIQKSHFLPLSEREVETKVEEFKSADYRILHVLGGALVAYMDLLNHQYANLRQGKPSNLIDESTNGALNSIREKAQAIVSFAGRLPIQFMSVIYSDLVKMEVLMRQ